MVVLVLVIAVFGASVTAGATTVLAVLVMAGAMAGFWTGLGDVICVNGG